MTEIIENTTSEPIPPTPFRPRFAGRLIERITGLGVPFQIAGEDNPIVRLDVKGIRWLKGDPRSRLHRMIGRWMRWMVILVLAVVLLDSFSILGNLENTAGYGYSLYYFMAGATLPSEYIAVLAFLFSLLMIIVGDFYYMANSLRAITPERESKRWEMIRLTPLSAENILNAKHAAVQLQSLRVLTLEYAPRFYIFIGYIPGLVLRQIRIIGPFSSLAGLFSLQSIATHGLLLLIYLFYLLEAGWRMRALTAIGLAISSRSRNAASSFIIAFFILMAVHIVEAIALFVPTYLFNFLIYNVSYSTVSDFTTPIHYIRTYLFPYLAVIFIGLAIYAIFHLFHRVALNYARRNAFRDV